MGQKIDNYNSKLMKQPQTPPPSTGSMQLPEEQEEGLPCTKQVPQQMMEGGRAMLAWLDNSRRDSPSTRQPLTTDIQTDRQLCQGMSGSRWISGRIQVCHRSF